MNSNYYVAVSDPAAGAKILGSGWSPEEARADTANAGKLREDVYDVLAVPADLAPRIEANGDTPGLAAECFARGRTAAHDLRLAYITNNAYDTVALLRGGKMLAHWTATPEVVAEYLNPGALEDWASNQTDAGEEITIADLGTELTGRELEERIAFYTRTGS